MVTATNQQDWHHSTEEFPPHVSINAIDSAEVVVPLVLSYVRARSVVDFGCKHGEWLHVFRRNRVQRLLGFDQQKRADRIIVEPSEFRVANLAEPITAAERFDLAVCIEVAEHLPAAAAPGLVRALTESAPVVMFSAAIPGQGGHGHLNEQPRSYWHDLFAAHGFRLLDCIRPHIWQDARVAWWYRQNLFLYAGAEGLNMHHRLKAEGARNVAEDLDLVHRALLQRRGVLRRLASRLGRS